MTDRLPEDQVPEDAASLTKGRLRADLRTAMRDRAALRVRALRSLIAALDNAEAIPPQDRHDRYVVHPFGDRSAEVARLVLTSEEVDGILQREAASRRADASILAAVGKADKASDVLAEAIIIDSYLRPAD